MSARPKITHYLVHEETGQRYPILQEVVVGRSGGDIIINDDAKLSSQHCRIIRTAQGLGVHDLGSSNGTYLDGARLHAEKIYVFKTGSLLTAGKQVFKLQEANVGKGKPARRKKRRRKKNSWDAVSVMAGVALICAALFFAHIYLRGSTKPEARVEITSPFQMVETEMRAAFAEYKELGRAKEAGELSDKGLANALRKTLVPSLIAVREKLLVIKPSGEFERRKLDANKKLVAALLDQVTAMALYADTKSPKHGQEVERLSALAAAANEELQKITEAPRQPSSNY